MVARFLPYIRQFATHSQLAGHSRARAGRATGPGLDAIIVPASRPATNLDHAVTLARAAKCQLVVLCSRDALAAEAAELLADRCFRQAVIVDLPADYSHELLSFASSDLARSELPDMCINPNGDLGTKRNLGLLVARMVGWGRIFFMDDDVRDIGLADLCTTVSMLDKYRSAGMRVTDFPDNSVVCHAHREIGAHQDVFVSGSALAVNCLEPFDFFPEVYNEDWLFFYNDVRQRQLGWSGRDATQLHYDPFDHAARAERQEFGDVLAEGLYALLHFRAGWEHATYEYWNDFLVERRKFLDEIIDHSTMVANEVREKMIRSVQTAMICLMQVQPRIWQEFIRFWQMDLRTWEESLKGVPRVGTAERALQEMGLRPTESVRLQRFQPPALAVGMRNVEPGTTAPMPRVTIFNIQGQGVVRQRHGTVVSPAAWDRAGPV